MCACGRDNINYVMPKLDGTDLIELPFSVCAPNTSDDSSCQVSVNHT